MAHKVQFTFGSLALADLDALKERVRSRSRAETIRMALKIMRWIKDEEDKGHQLFIDTGSERQYIKFLHQRRIDARIEEDRDLLDGDFQTGEC